MRENLEIYNMVKDVPERAQKTIKGGRLSGMTDIKPMWRIEKLTELFGMAGIGWKATITNKEIIEGANGEKIAVVDIDLFVKVDGEWSEAIQGTGGSSFVASERNGLYTSDECFKMAYTDAISVACKSLGFGAEIYWGDSKYQKNNKTEYTANEPVVERRSGKKISEAQATALDTSLMNNNISQERTKEVLSKYGYKRTTDIEVEDYGAIIGEFRKEKSN